MKVYVVTDGDYSDYHICGVYSTKELAEHGKALFSGRYGAAGVEEYELDDDKGVPFGMLPWGVRMGRDGEAREAERESADGQPLKEWAPYGDDETVYFEMFATDEQHAIKIANERRAGLIASGEWTTDWDAWSKRKRKEG